MSGPAHPNLKYARQVDAGPPTFVLLCTRAAKSSAAYMAFVTNSLRKTFRLHGVPLRVHLRDANAVDRRDVPERRGGGAGSSGRKTHKSSRHGGRKRACGVDGGRLTIAVAKLPGRRAWKRQITRLHVRGNKFLRHNNLISVHRRGSVARGACDDPSGSVRRPFRCKHVPSDSCQKTSMAYAWCKTTEHTDMDRIEGESDHVTYNTGSHHAALSDTARANFLSLTPAGTGTRMDQPFPPRFWSLRNMVTLLHRQNVWKTK